VRPAPRLAIEGLGQVVLGVRQSPGARYGRLQVALEGSGGYVPEQTPCGMPLRFSRLGLLDVG
jgi:hypothetical protein